MLKRYDKTIQSNLNALIVKLENTITLFVSIIDHVDVANITVGPRFNEKEITMSQRKIICCEIINQFSNFLDRFKEILGEFAPYVPSN